MIGKEELVPKYLVALIESLRERLGDAGFIARHRSREQDFTRQRCLSFGLVMLFTLQKTIQSVQRHLHEFLSHLVADPTAWESVTPQAWAKARVKLRPSAFVALNTECVLPTA